MEDTASSDADGFYIYTYLDAWCHIFHVWNDRIFQRSSCGLNKDDVQSIMWWITDICYFSERIHISNIYVQWCCDKIYLAERIYPIGGRAMDLFGTVEENHHQCEIDNLYNSYTFLKAVYNYEKKYWLNVLQEKGVRGIPPSIKQDGLNSKKAYIETMGT